MLVQNIAAEGDVAAYRGLVLSKYDVRAASTRQRVLQLMPYLARQGILLEIAPLFDNSYLEEVLLQGRRSIFSTLRAYFKRLVQLYHARDYDFIWIQYELFPYLPGLLERWGAACKKPIILDYDDAIFHQYDQHRNPLLRGLLKNKLKPLLRRANLVLCGNRYLQDYVGRYCSNTAIFPTVVDIDHYMPQTQKAPRLKPVIGWIGSPSTWKYHAQAVVPLLHSLVKEGVIDVRVVGAGPAADYSLPFTFCEWNETTEIAEIQSMDVGIMPIPDEPWARGKCGYKLIQYMACGLPVVASPVGVNEEIVVRGISGFLARTEEEWRAAITLLAGDAGLRTRMGEAGRKIIESRYSIQHYGPQVSVQIATLLSKFTVSAPNLLIHNEQI